MFSLRRALQTQKNVFSLPRSRHQNEIEAAGQRQPVAPDNRPPTKSSTFSVSPPGETKCASSVAILLKQRDSLSLAPSYLAMLLLQVLFLLQGS